MATFVVAASLGVGLQPVAGGASVPTAGTITTVNAGPLTWPVYVVANGELIEGSGGRSPTGLFRIEPDGTTTGGSGGGGYLCMPPLAYPDPLRRDCHAKGVARRADGAMFYAWEQNHWVAGGGPASDIRVGTYNTAGFAGDGGPAGQALLESPQGIALDPAGNLYIVDRARIRKVDPNGTITTFAGTGVSGFSGDGGPATSAQIRDHTNPRFITADHNGNVYVGDRLNARIRKIDTNGTITTVAGNGTNATSPDGSVAATSPVLGVGGLAIAPTGELLFTETTADKVRMIDQDGLLRTVAGTGVGGFSGDGGPATDAMLDAPWGLAFDPDGNLLVADSNNNRIRRITFTPGAIDGTLTAGGAPAAGVTVTLMADWPSWQVVQTTTTDAAGDYRFDDVPWGRYKLRFFDPQGRYQRQWWTTRDTYTTGTTAIVASGTTTTADDTLTPAVAALTGRITTTRTGQGLPGAHVQLYTTTGYLAGATTGPDGYYRFNAIPPGTYTLRAVDPTHGAHRSAWYPGVPDHPSATTLTITPGTTTASITLRPWT